MRGLYLSSFADPPAAALAAGMNAEAVWSCCAARWVRELLSSPRVLLLPSYPGESQTIPVRGRTEESRVYY